MSPSILSIVLLVSPAPLPSSAPPSSLFEPESGAWAVVHGGQLWVCWAPAPDCFARVVFDDDERRLEDRIEDDDPAADEALDEFNGDIGAREFGSLQGAEPWQLGFADARSLWVELGEQRWRVVRGQRRARLVDDPAPIRLRRIGPASCGPAAVVPAMIGGGLGWREAPRCAVDRPADSPTQICMAPAGPRLGRRRPTAIRLRAGLELASIRTWAIAEDPDRNLIVATRRYVSAVQFSVVVELGFDWQRASADRRAQASLEGRRRAQRRELPKVAPGPLAAAEIEALADVMCAVEQP